jgi:hypothetical protein
MQDCFFVRPENKKFNVKINICKKNVKMKNMMIFLLTFVEYYKSI